MTLQQKIDRLRAAITDMGPLLMARHRAECPTLWRAIDALLAQRNRAMSDTQERAAAVIEACHMNQSIANSEELAAALAAAGLLVDDDTARLREAGIDQ